MHLQAYFVSSPPCLYEVDHVIYVYSITAYVAMHGVRIAYLKPFALEDQTFSDGNVPVCKHLGQCLELCLRCLQPHSKLLIVSASSHETDTCRH